MDRGWTIIEKFEKEAKQVGFTVVLLTADGLGGMKFATSSKPRARQNVVFELGYFVGKIEKGNVCLLRKGEIEGFWIFTLCCTRRWTAVNTAGRSGWRRS